LKLVDDSMFCTTTDCQKNITNHHVLIHKPNNIATNLMVYVAIY
jgi:hypothetical protein